MQCRAIFAARATLVHVETPYTVAASVLAFVQNALDAAERPVAKTLVAVGGFVVDDCCAGHLAVAPERIWRTGRRWPEEASADDTCGDNPIAVDLVVRLDRCVPVVQTNGNPPDAAKVEAAHAVILGDAAIIWNALASADILDPDEWERANLNQQFLPAEGGCLAIETRVTFGVPSDLWCDA